MDWLGVGIDWAVFLRSALLLDEKSRRLGSWEMVGVRVGVDIG